MVSHPWTRVTSTEMTRPTCSSVRRSQMHPATRGDAGEAYVIFGQPQFQGSVDLAEGEQDVTVFGAAAGDNLGLSVVAADLNGDGIDDIIVGSRL
jgi:hypothetical protein